MIDLKETMQGMAKRAPDVDDLAERSISRGRRRRTAIRGAGLAAGAVAVAMVASTTVVAVANLREKQEYTTAADQPYTLEQGDPPREIDLSEETPAPLPGGKVGAIDLAYVPGGTFCRDHPGDAKCAWRLVRADGTSWRLTDVHIEDNLVPALTVSNAVQLAPEGDRLAYVRADGATVVRDLLTGRVQIVGRHKMNETPGWPLAWSLDGRWLALSGLPADGGAPDIGVTIVDTKTGARKTLPYSGGSWGDGVLGLPNDGQPIPIFTATYEDPEKNGGNVMLMDRDGRLTKRLMLKLDDGRVASLLGGGGAISPDGEQLVAFPQTYGEDIFAQQHIRLTDLGTGRETTVLGNPPKPAYSWNGVLGWQDDSTFVIGDMTRENKSIHLRQVYAADTKERTFRAVIRFVGQTTPLEGLRLATARL